MYNRTVFQEVTRSGITTNKSQSSNLVIFSLYSENPAYDQTFLQNYAEINLVPLIKRVNGVGEASAFDRMDYSMRIWLKPDVMASYGLIPADVNALTLSPALGAIFLKSHKEDEGHKKNLVKRFYTAFNTAFATTTNKYKRSVSFLFRRKWVAWAGIAVFAGIFILIMRTTPTTFVPNEDMGAIMANISLPPSASVERTREITNEVKRMAKSIPEILTVLKIDGRGMISGAGSNYGMVIMRLIPWSQRTGKGQDIQSITGKIR